MAIALTMQSVVLALCLLPFVCGYSFQEKFEEGWSRRWMQAVDEKYKGKFEVETLDPDKALKVPTKAFHYGLTAMLDESFEPSEGVILQFEAKYAKGQTCSGAYMKFYGKDDAFKPEEMQEDTPYTVMFGPDVCGSTSKVHLILNHKNPKTEEIVEKHLQSPPRVKSDKKTHVYTAHLKPDNTFEVMVDGAVVSEGSLFEKFDPPFNPPEEILDPEDKKPADWVDNAKIDDPDAVKPEDWVEDPLMDNPDAVKPEGWLDDTPIEIPDPEAVKPEDWDEEEDGEWIPPTIANPLCKEAPGCGEWKRPQKRNPEYKGPWKPPKIDNPDYKGEWTQKTIPNPDYYKDETPLKSMAPIGSLGFELWTMDGEIFFDNIVVTKDPELAATYREKWSDRNKIETAVEEAEREKQKKESEKESAFGFLRQILDHPALTAVRPYLEPVVVFLENQSQGFYGFVAIVASLVFATLIRWCCRGRKKDKVAQRKKKDISEPDDPPQQQPPEASSSGTSPNDKEEEEEETPNAARSRRSH